MKIRVLALLGFVFSGAVTACAEPNRSTSAEQDWGASIGDSGAVVAQDAGELDGSTGSGSIPLVVRPTAPDLPRCTSPYAPVLASIPTGEQLPVFANAEDGVAVGLGDANAVAPASSWVESNEIALPAAPARLTVFAKLVSSACPSAMEFVHEYSAVDSFAPGADGARTTAIANDDSRFSAWATKILSVSYGAGVTTAWQTPQRALGPATTDSTDIVSLGEGGTISLGFDVTITDGAGFDFAVFENGFADNYLELAFVEVSSDGVHFVRFDSASLVATSVGAYGTMDPTQLEGLAGKYRVGFGTPFDLAWLKSRPEVQSGLVKLSQITVVRVVDVIGDGRNRDSFGHVIYDPYPTTGSAGFDLDAVGVINTAP